MEKRCKILVVDDDSTSLSTMSAMFKHWGYEVVTAKYSAEALHKIRNQKDIDLVVTEFHMPEKNGLELKKQIHKEFNLPVIVMSVDDQKNVIMKTQESGVVFLLPKPEDLKNVWQLVITSKQGRKNSRRKASEKGKDKKNFRRKASEKGKGKKNSRRKAQEKGKGKQEEEAVTSPRKGRWAWDEGLNNRFFQAIEHISPGKAVPKKILELMNFPGLTREHVASRLQRYRNSLKRVAEKGIAAASKDVRSSFTSGHSLMILEAAHDAQFREKQQQMRTSSFLPGNGGSISSLNGSSFGSNIGFPSLGDSSNNSGSQRALLENQAKLHQSLIGNTTNPLYQTNHGTTFGIESNNMRANSLSFGGMSGGNTSGINLNHMHRQKSQTRLELRNDNVGAPSFKSFSTSGGNTDYTSGFENMGTINNNPYSNYAGGGLINEGEFFVAGQMNVSGNGLKGGYGLIMTNGTTGNEIVTAGFISSGQDNTSVMLPLSSRQHYGIGNNGQNDFINYGLMNNAKSSVIGNTAQLERFREGIVFDNLLLFQQQGGEGGLNLNSGTHQAQLNLSTNQSQNSELSAAFSVGDNAPNPWNEPTLEQPHEIEQLLNQVLSSNADNADLLIDYDPSFDQNANQLQQGNQSNLNNSELNGLNPPDIFSFRKSGLG